jgi:hypothetical protein
MLIWDVGCGPSIYQPTRCYVMTFAAAMRLISATSQSTRSDLTEACIAAAEATVSSTCDGHSNGRIPGWLKYVESARERLSSGIVCGSSVIALSMAQLPTP